MRVDNFRAVMDRSRRGTIDPELGLLVARHLAWLWSLGGQITEGRAWMGQLLSLTENRGRTPLRGYALTYAGGLAWQQGDLPAAKALAEESIEIWKEDGDRRGMAEAWSLLATVATSEGDPGTAIPLYQQSTAVLRETGGDPWMMIYLLNSFGGALIMSGDLEGARAIVTEALQVAESRGDPFGWGRALVLNSLAGIASAEGDYGQAASLFSQSAEAFQGVGDRWTVIWPRIGLAHVALRQGDYAQAVRLFTESLTAWKQTGNKDGMLMCLEALARIAVAQGDHARAARLFAAGSPGVYKPAGIIFAADDPTEHDRAMSKARGALGEEAWQAEWRRGERMSLDEAVEYALEESDAGVREAPPGANTPGKS